MLLCPLILPADNATGTVGLSVIKEAGNPTDYSYPAFANNPIGEYDPSDLHDESDVSAYLNAMNIGRKVTDFLFNYQLVSMDKNRFLERMPPKADSAYTEDDYVNALENNYVLVVRMDEKSRHKVLAGDTSRFMPTGHWFLYRVCCNDSTFDELNTNFINPTDSPETKGTKRVCYERISIPLRFVASGTDIGRNLTQNLAGKIRYSFFTRKSDASHPYKVRKTSTALKVALSPFLILKD